MFEVLQGKWNNAPNAKCLKKEKKWESLSSVAGVVLKVKCGNTKYWLGLGVFCMKTLSFTLSEKAVLVNSLNEL